jgi:signal peptidase I
MHDAQQHHQPPADQPAHPTPPSQHTDWRNSRGWKFFKIAASWLLALVIAIAIQRYAFQSYQVFGQSMEPTLHEGDYLVISKLGASLAKFGNNNYIPKRGDIIVIDSSLTGTRLIKRVIGLPGERVTVSGGSVTIYNKEHPDGFNPYEALNLPERFTDGQLTTEVPAGNVFVIGDNRQAGNSLDSRNELGPVPAEHIIGQLAVRLWPFKQPQQD